jgi:hypothetical protein
MNAIKVNKADLLVKLRTNRATHLDQFERASERFLKIVTAELEGRLAEARKGKVPNLAWAHPMPVNQTKEYDKAIGMLEMSIEDVIELEEHDYKNYVLDEWSWSAQTTASNSRYL